MGISPLAQFTEEQQRQIRRKGALGATANKLRKKSLRQHLELLLAQPYGEATVEEEVCLALVKKALDGDVKAFTTIRDTIGEKPSEKVEHTGEMPTVKLVCFEDETARN